MVFLLFFCVCWLQFCCYAHSRFSSHSLCAHGSRGIILYLLVNGTQNRNIYIVYLFLYTLHILALTHCSPYGIRRNAMNTPWSCRDCRFVTSIAAAIRRAVEYAAMREYFSDDLIETCLEAAGIRISIFDVIPEKCIYMNASGQCKNINDYALRRLLI